MFKWLVAFVGINANKRMDNLSKYLEDINFISWVFEPSAELDAIWEKCQTEHPEEVKNIRLARKVILQFRTVAKSLSEEEKILLFSRVLKQIEEKQRSGKTTRILIGFAKYDNIVGIKNTSLDFAQTVQYIYETKHLDNFKVLAGSDYFIYATLAYGGAGCVAGTANVAPALVVDIYNKFQAGDLAGALEAQYKLVPLRNTYSFGSFPVVMKDCLNLMGLNVGHPVKPIDHCTEERLQALKVVLSDLNLID